MTVLNFAVIPVENSSIFLSVGRAKRSSRVRHSGTLKFGYNAFICRMTSSPVNTASKDVSARTAPTSRLTAFGSRVTSAPSSVPFPVSGFASPRMMRNVVVLPDPLTPMSAVMVSFGTCIVRSSVKSAYRFVMRSSVITSFVIVWLLSYLSYRCRRMFRRRCRPAAL